MATNVPPFLEPVEKLRHRLIEIENRKSAGSESDPELTEAHQELQAAIQSVFSSLSPWQRCQVARHPDRPYTLAYIHDIFSEFTELHGDRRFSDDPAIVAGFGKLGEEAVAIVGHQKGRDTAEKVRRNFGMPRPEGYRKALRIMKLAARYRRPIISFIDTPGAYPGIDAEERGQAEAIADNLIEMARLPVPIIVVVTGEGGSGGALALGVGDRILMLEYSIYSVISPEGCAAILWKDQAQAETAASALRLTSSDLLKLRVVDEVLPEPPGGAHMDPGGMSNTIGGALQSHLRQLKKLRPEVLISRRYKKFRSMGYLGSK